MKPVVYVLCYDDASEAAARLEFAQYGWAIVTRLPDDPNLNRYMEGAAFLKTLPEKRAEWQDADLVGVLSYKAVSKIDVSMLMTACQESCGTDVVAFLPSTEHLMFQSVQSHPHFLEVWVPLLLHLGYDACDAVSANMPSFFCNYWLATPSWMDKFLAFYATARQALELLPGIQKALWSDAGYRNNLTLKRCMQLYERPYIPHHPFVCERLACFFFWKEQAVISLAPLGKKEFWEEYYAYQMKHLCIRAKLLEQHMPPR